MNDTMVIEVGRRALLLMLYISGPMLLTALVVGLVISIFQAATQINEMTLAFIPKVVITGFVLLYTLPNMIHLFRDFFVQVMSMVPQILP